ncbi:tuberin-like [Rhagoletis pomonella]|uniref:tuberin-like n=1 Tax=Rhagoletis pomonella TaxID=28610 RepID=UPI0017856915|nr:tuberin-like [Rhagoletis pomonella]
MSSKDKEISKSKFKFFTKNAKGVAGGASERLLRPEIERELRPEQTTAQRCKTLSELQLHNLKLEEASITELWTLTKDLIIPNKPAECRQTALTFYKRLIQTQYKNLNLLRHHFFYVIQNHEVPEDLKHRLELLDTLTDNGKDIQNFEEKIGKFMLQWIPAITEARLLRPYLDILGNIIKFNASLLDKDIVVGIVQNACHLSCTVEEDDIGLQCLTILEMVMCYTIFPSEPLAQCVVTLCRTVNHSPYCPASWKIMKNLLGTQLGYHSMKMMCNILNDRSLYADQQLLRGAVFHLNMNIFGSNVVFQVSPMFYASTVLTSFLHALDSRQVIVTFEVILSVRRVINYYKSELPEIIWDCICDTMNAILDNIEYYERININKDRLHNLQINFHENIDCIEKLLYDDKAPILANINRIYDLIERVAENRTETSVLKLIEYRSTKVTATRPQWLQVLNDFVCRFYKMPNTNVRLKAIQSLVRIMDLNRFSYEEEILDRVVIPQFSQIAHEADLEIRVAVANALVGFVRHCDTKRCGELLDILEKLINRPFEQQLIAGESTIKSESDILDVVTAVHGLIEIFGIKLHRLPSTHAIKIFNILIGHLETHYDRPKVFEHARAVRFKIFKWILRARSNASYHIGYPDSENGEIIKFSAYLGIDSSLPPQGHQHGRHQLTSHDIIAGSHFTTISIRRACKIIVKCLDLERDYEVLQSVIKELPKVLCNKALIQGNDIEALAVSLFRIFQDVNKTLHLSYCPTSDEVNALFLPAIASLVIYHQSISSHQINTLILALCSGIFSGTANVCINTLTTMILEMPDTLTRTLADILLQMSKMSDTTMVAIPVLEFLSILSRMPNQYFTNFIPRQYMYVFAISLPYTKPNRYDHYTVSLAHHVIAGWFLKCKLEMRKNFVTYIISSIQSNASMLYDDIDKFKHSIQRQDLNSLNEDSSNRKRSTSLTERGSRNTSVRNGSDMRPPINDSLKSFHAELAETCIDFLARHTFSPCSALPKRLPAVEYLLKDGFSQTWVVGHNLITITTSGCPTAPIRNGLCDRCSQMNKQPLSNNVLIANKSESSSTAPLSPEATNTHSSGAPSTVERRYTKASLQYSSGNESAGSTDLTSSSSSASAAMNTNTAITQRQISNSSTASLEALSRRGSNPEPTEGGGGAASGSTTSLLGGHSLSTTSISASPTQLQAVQQQTCIRSCTGWAEILIRRPTGNISWITRIQNPIANDCFGQDLPFSNIVSLFLPTAHGGVFGPDFVQSALMPEHQQETGVQLDVVQPTTKTLPAPDTTIGPESDDTVQPATNPSAGAEERKSGAFTKARPLQRQEEISSSTTMPPSAASLSTAAIDIPKPLCTKRAGGKEALADSVSDGEADDDTMQFADGLSRARNPVRRVNSSPEMSSSWRQTFLTAKPAPLATDSAKAKASKYSVSLQGLEEVNQQQQMQLQQKKKSVQYTKDMRVSCEAIPEEIAGSTPPQAQSTDAPSDVVPAVATDKSAIPTVVTSAVTAGQMLITTSTATITLPPKQHSADDVSISASVPASSVQQSSSGSSLKLNVAVEKVASKPPHSPATATAPSPQSPRLDKQPSGIGASKTATFTNAPSTIHQGLAKSSSSGGGNANLSGGSSYLGGGGGDYGNGSNGDMMRGRSKTISVVREVNGRSRPTTSNFRSFNNNSKPSVNAKLCMNPSFVFMQLYHTGQLQVTDVPIKVPPEETNVLTVLDLAPPFETHKIGVLYVGQGQCNNVVEILRNSHGSMRYVEFLSNIGTLVSLKEAEQKNLFVNLDRGGADGKFTYVWKDDIVQVTFHVATLMPTNLQKDPNCNEKKKHIGNDFVKIVYNESGEEYNLNTISGHFNYACVIVEPLELNSNRVYVKARPEISKFVCHPEPKIVSDHSAPLLARQLALHANLASQVYQSLQKKNPYASNWLERLRIIKRLRTKLIEQQNNQHQSGSSAGTDPDDHTHDPLKKQNTNRDFTKYA